MGDIPKERLTPCKAFTNVGLDYFGPLLIKYGDKRSRKLVKAWVALFICLYTRAVHLELVTDLTTVSFINALKRLVSRRGRVSLISSDNAKTFVGAKRELDKVQQFLSDPSFQKSIGSFLTEEGIVWKFIPPRSPNFGGLWERLVRSAKTHFKKTVLNSTLTQEEVNTLIIQIEAVINSRPLVPMSDDPMECDVLTPAHFLVGQSLFAIPEIDLMESRIDRLTRWQRVQQLHQSFWKRWQTEVITQLQTRSKWNKEAPSTLKEGDLVLISEDNLPPLKWKCGRIVNLIPGPDDLVRVADVRTADGIYRRSIRKLARLPTASEVLD